MGKEKKKSFKDLDNKSISRMRWEADDILQFEEALRRIFGLPEPWKKFSFEKEYARFGKALIERLEQRIIDNIVEEFLEEAGRNRKNKENKRR